MALTDADVREFRERVKSITVRAGATEEQADNILLRIGARLAGHTHEEAVAMYPEPPDATP